MSPPIANAFTYFPRLPVELQLKVWQFALPLPRIIELSWKSKTSSMMSLTSCPAVLHSCKLARDELIHHYGRVRMGDTSEIILVDFLRDTLFFSQRCADIDVFTTSGGVWTSSPEVNPKVLQAISRSISLRKNVHLVAFDSAFLEVFEFAGGLHVLSNLYGILEKVDEILIVPHEHWKKAKKQCRHPSVVGMKLVEIEETIGTESFRGVHYTATIRPRQRIRIMDVEPIQHTVVHDEKPTNKPKGSFGGFLRKIVSRPRHQDRNGDA